MSILTSIWSSHKRQLYKNGILFSQFYNCYCGNNSVGVKVKDTKCSAACPNPYLDVYKCGSPFRLTMYDSTGMYYYSKYKTTLTTI